jgi:hypothetical protein
MARAGEYEVVGPVYRFNGDPQGDPDRDVPGRSTRDALAKVEFTDRHDLRGRLAYPSAPEAVSRVVLAKRPIETPAGRRSAILVFSADGPDAGVSDRLTEADALGRLSPVQFYVMGSGLERAASVLEVASERLRDLGDEWGFVRVRRRGAHRAVSVTPPIVERVHRDDAESAEGEFLICDGNHRVVQRVWIEGRPIAAVAIDDNPVEPYYARPFSSLEWETAAGNVVSDPPLDGGKYVPRRVDLSRLSDESRRELRETPESQRHYRYFRNLEKGFGYLGGQAGRTV